MTFHKAKDLADQIQNLVSEYGENLQIAFHIDEETISNANDNIIGAIKIDGVEKTSTPRLDLTFDIQG